jgi:hypothetical protein
MLLRRITKHVTEQNWFAVFIDFLIVVVGVFIGIQVANWNEAQSDARRETVILERLQNDFQRIVEWGEDRNPKVAMQAESTSQLIGMLRNNESPLEDKIIFPLISDSVQVWAPFELSATYSELVSGGRLSAISNPNLREALAVYGRNRDNELIMLDIQLKSRDDVDIHHAIQFVTDHTDITSHATPISYDWDELRNIQPQLQIIFRNQMIRKQWNGRVLEQAKIILELLETELSNTPDKSAHN